jgi:hypothetical protein
MKITEIFKNFLYNLKSIYFPPNFISLNAYINLVNIKFRMLLQPLPDLSRYFLFIFLHFFLSFRQFNRGDRRLQNFSRWAYIHLVTLFAAQKETNITEASAAAIQRH